MKKLMKWAVATGFAIAAPAMSGVFYPDGTTTLHFAFEGSPNGDRPIIRPPAFYRADDGFGFVDSPAVVGTSRGVTAPKYFRFDVNVPPGNYDVSFIPGGTQGESVTTVKAEGHRAMLLDARAAGGRGGRGGGQGAAAQNLFTVNVRRGAGQPETLDTDARLNLEFIGSSPSMMKLDIVPNAKAITVFLLGDDTVADSEKVSQAGWGQMLPILFKAGEVAVANHGATGFSAQAFLDQHGMDSIGDSMKAGDYLLLQLAANDLGDASKGKGFVQRYASEAQKHQAKLVVIVAPSQQPTPAPQWLTDAAQEQKIPLLDINRNAGAFIEKLGAQNPAALVVDGSHFSAYGAMELAKLVALELSAQKVDLASHLVEGIANNPDPSQFPAHLGYEFLKN